MPFPRTESQCVNKCVTCRSRSVDVEQLVVEVVQLLNRVRQRIRERVDDFRVDIRHAPDRRRFRAGDEQLNGRADFSRDFLNSLALESML
jgi:hypothetical protein